MVVLKQIKRDKNVISAMYYPENQEQGGFLSVDIETGDEIESTPAPGYGTCDAARYYGRMKLLNLAKKKDLPKETYQMWY